MTADEAAQTWFTRGSEIIEQFKRMGPSVQLWSESGTAANGASALLQNRYNELSPVSVDRLQKLVDAMADVQAKSLDSAQGSPLGEAADEFYNALRGEVIVGARAVGKAATIGAGVLGAALILYAILVLK